MKLRTWEVTEDVLFLFSHQSCLTLQPYELQHSRILEFVQIHSLWVQDFIQLSHTLHSPSPPALNLSQNQDLFWWVGSLHQVDKALAFQLQHCPSNELVWSPCCPRDSQESSPTPQLESVNSSALRLLYDPTLTSIHDYWENYNFD